MIKLIDLDVYKVALLIAEKVWIIVNRWDYFNKDTLGKQFVKAADSIALILQKVTDDSFTKKTGILIITEGDQHSRAPLVLRKPLKEN